MCLVDEVRHSLCRNNESTDFLFVINFNRECSSRACRHKEPSLSFACISREHFVMKIKTLLIHSNIIITDTQPIFFKASITTFTDQDMKRRIITSDCNNDTNSSLSSSSIMFVL